MHFAYYAQYALCKLCKICILHIMHSAHYAHYALCTLCIMHYAHNILCTLLLCTLCILQMLDGTTVTHFSVFYCQMAPLSLTQLYALLVGLSIKNLWTILKISGSRNRTILTISGYRNHIIFMISVSRNCQNGRQILAYPRSYSPLVCPELVEKLEVGKKVQKRP